MLKKYSGSGCERRGARSAANGPRSLLDPPLAFAAAVVLMISLAMAVPEPRVVTGGPRLLGLVPVSLGWALHAWAWRTFSRRSTTVRSDGEPRALVTDGPYARTRNPMYLAGVMILLGTGILLGAAVPFLAPLLYGILAHRVFLPAEERVLSERFGEPYRVYRATVSAWL